MLRDDHAADSDESVGPERRRLGEHDAHCLSVDLLDLDVLVAADGGCGGRGIRRVFPVEKHVVGAKRLAVVPLHVLLEFPDDRLAVLRHAAVLHARDFRCEKGNQVAVGVPVRERFVEDARAVLVLGADREVRIEQGRSLPPQQFQGAAAAALCGLVAGGGRLRLRHTRMHQQMSGHRRRQPESDHGPDKPSARYLAGIDLPNQIANFVLVHRHLLRIDLQCLASISRRG